MGVAFRPHQPPQFFRVTQKVFVPTQNLVNVRRRSFFMSRRLFKPNKSPVRTAIWGLASIGLLATLFAGLTLLSPDAESGPLITVYKSRSCGCCAKWISHLQQNGFQVVVKNHNDLPAIKKQHGIKPELRACHTGLVGDYLVEGHVPADVIKRLLKEHPDIKGIAVPGMPVGSPGMEGPNPRPYKILAFDTKGNTSVYDAR